MQVAQSEPVAWDPRPLPQVVAWAVYKGLGGDVRKAGHLKGWQPVLLNFRNPTESHCVLGTAAGWPLSVTLSCPLSVYTVRGPDKEVSS